jgi:capsular polysaccharide biosynthesis protein
MTRFSLRHYWFLFKRYWLSLLLAAGLAGAATFFLQNRQPLEYMSQTKVYIGTALASLNTDPKVIVSSIELADIYAEYAKNDVLLSQALDDLELPDRLEDMRWRVSTEVISGHPFLYLRVVYTDPQIAADLANAIVQNMINTVSANQSGDIDAQIDNLQAKIDNLNILINITNSEYQIAYNLLQQVRLEERHPMSRLTA